MSRENDRLEGQSIVDACTTAEVEARIVRGF
jgi:hypothetical protein